MSLEEKTSYTKEELKEFDQIISTKLEAAKAELKSLKESLSHKNDPGETSSGQVKTLEDGADTMEKESITQLASRQQKFVNQLENAAIRIKNGTYGVCIDTGKLIPKERLKAVPHTMQTIEAKLKQS